MAEDRNPAPGGMLDAWGIMTERDKADVFAAIDELDGLDGWLGDLSAVLDTVAQAADGTGCARCCLFIASAVDLKRADVSRSSRRLRQIIGSAQPCPDAESVA